MRKFCVLLAKVSLLQSGLHCYTQTLASSLPCPNPGLLLLIVTLFRLPFFLGQQIPPTASCSSSHGKTELLGLLVLFMSMLGEWWRNVWLTMVWAEKFGWTYSLRAPTAPYLQCTSTSLSKASDWEPLAFAIYLHIYCPAFCINYAVSCMSMPSAAPPIKLIIQVPQHRHEATLDFAVGCLLQSTICLNGSILSKTLLADTVPTILNFIL